MLGDSFRKMAILAAVSSCAVMVAAGQAAAPKPAISLTCEILTKGRARAAHAGTCATFADAFQRRLGRPVVVTAGPPPASAADALRLRLTQPRPHALEAAVNGRLRGRQVVAGPVAIDAMDRGLSQPDVERLADAIATTIKSG